MAADTVTSTTSVIVSCVGLALGSSVGLVDGDRLGPELGVVVGKRVVGDAVGFEVVGPDDGDVLGISVVGLPEGDVLGCFVGLELGAAVIGLADGGVVCPLRVGDWVGVCVGDSLGLCDGDVEGVLVDGLAVGAVDGGFVDSTGEEVGDMEGELDGMAVVGGVVGESVTGEDEGVLVGGADGESVQPAGLYNSDSRYNLSGGKFECIGKTLSISLVVALIPNHSAVPSHMASHE